MYLYIYIYLDFNTETNLCHFLSVHHYKHIDFHSEILAYSPYSQDVPMICENIIRAILQDSVITMIFGLGAALAAFPPVMQACAGSLVKRGGGTGFFNPWCMHAYVYIYICIYIYSFWYYTPDDGIIYIYIYMIVHAYDSKPIFYDTTYTILDVYNYVHIDAYHMLCILYTHTYMLSYKYTT